MNKLNIPRSSKDRVVAGVCGGLAEHFDLKPSWVRLGFLCLTGASSFLFAFVYGALIVLMPNPGPSPATSPTPGATPSRSRFAHAPGCQPPVAPVLREVQSRFASLDRRLQRLESIVTSRSFEAEEKWRSL